MHPNHGHGLSLPPLNQLEKEESGCLALLSGELGVADGGSGSNSREHLQRMAESWKQRGGKAKGEDQQHKARSKPRSYSTL